MLAVNVCTYIYVYIYVYMCIYVHVCVCLCVYVYIQVGNASKHVRSASICWRLMYIYVYMYIYICIYVYVCVFVCVCVYTGWKRLETRQRCVDMVAANVAAFALGSPVNVVNANSAA